MANNNDVDVTIERDTLNITDLGDITDDELDDLNELEVTVLTDVIPDGEPILENKPLSPRNGLCTNMTKLVLVNCSRIPPEISNCTALSILYLKFYGNDDIDCRIEFPKGIILLNLTCINVRSSSGNGNTGGIMSWLVMSCPNLTILNFFDLPNDTAIQFMRLLQNNEAFIEQFKHKLLKISFIDCNLNEEDALTILIGVGQLYPRLRSIDLRHNNIDSIETIGTAMRETPPANNNLLLSNLKALYLESNPFPPSLNVLESSDSVALTILLKCHQRLWKIENSPTETIFYSSLVDYWLMLNESEIPNLLNNGHGGTRLNILPYVMYHVYNQREQDLTALFTFLREEHIFRTNYYNDNHDGNGNGDDNNNRICCCMVSFTSIFVNWGLTK